MKIESSQLWYKCEKGHWHPSMERSAEHYVVHSLLLLDLVARFAPELMRPISDKVGGDPT